MKKEEGETQKMSELANQLLFFPRASVSERMCVHVEELRSNSDPQICEANFNHTAPQGKFPKNKPQPLNNNDHNQKANKDRPRRTNQPKRTISSKKQQKEQPLPPATATTKRRAARRSSPRGFRARVPARVLVCAYVCLYARLRACKQVRVLTCTLACMLAR